MAFFGVEIRKISSISDHPQADRLSIGTVEGLAFQFVTKKDQFKVGDAVIYIPVDSVLPVDVREKLGLVGKLAGKNKDRVKTISLRQAISQGVVASPEILLPPEMLTKSSEEMTQFLGITKFEPPFKNFNSGVLHPLPDGYGKYDIESADRFTSVVSQLMDQEVVVHEKMEGTNFSVIKKDDKIFVNQRQNSIEEFAGQENDFWKAARQSGLIDYLKNVPGDIAVYAELCGPGIQKNIYKLKDLTLFVFDVKKNYRWMSFDEYETFTKDLGLTKAPLLFRGTLRNYLQDKSVQAVSNGASVVNPSHLREGIVIKPVVEQRDQLVGRLIIKQRSPDYLAKED